MEKFSSNISLKLNSIFSYAKIKCMKIVIVFTKRFVGIFPKSQININGRSQELFRMTNLCGKFIYIKRYIK